MKKNILYLSVLLLLLMVSSCRKAKKNYDDYLPKVKTISAVVQPDATIIVTGELESSGASVVTHVGLCCSTSSDPKMLDKEIVCQISNNRFTGTYQPLSIDSPYYFRTWATNKYGYSYGNIITLASVAPPATVAPCTLAAESYDNGATFGSGTYSGSPQSCYYNSALSVYEIQANSATITVDFQMNAPLSVGMYTITNGGFGPGYREMYISFIDGSYYTLGAGTAYVNDLGGGLFDVAICDAPWVLTGSTILHFKTRFTAKNI